MERILSLSHTAFRRSVISVSRFSYFPAVLPQTKNDEDKFVEMAAFRRSRGELTTGPASGGAMARFTTVFALTQRFLLKLMQKWIVRMPLT